jgi:hypothetical protein
MEPQGLGANQAAIGPGQGLLQSAPVTGAAKLGCTSLRGR